MLWAIAGAVVLVLFLFFVVLRIVKKLRPGPAPARISGFLDGGMRRGLQPAERVIRRSGVEAGTRVLDLGCGSGTITVPLARRMGSEGRVFAADLRALPFADATFDRVLIVNALPEVPDRQDALGEVWRALRPGGALAVSEFFIDPDFPLRSTTRRRCEAAGFEPVDSAGRFWDYTMVFRKPAYD